MSTNVTFTQDTTELPAAAFSIPVELDLGSNGEEAKTAPISILARTHAIQHPVWGKVEHDFSGMAHRSRIALDYCHIETEVVGYANRFIVDDLGLTLRGALIPFKEDRASEIMHRSRNGVPYSGSIDFRGAVKVEKVPAGTSAQVNGHAFDGPGVIIRQWTLRGCAVCPYGADENATAMVFNQNATGNFPVHIMKEETMSNPVQTQPETEETVPAVVEPETAAVPVVDPAPAAQLSVPVEPAPAVVIEAAPAEPAEPVAPAGVEANDPASVAKKFLNAYGEAGLKWLAEGVSFEDCQGREVERLRAENADMASKLAAVQLPHAAPVKFSAAPVPAATPTLKEAPKSFTQGEQAVFHAIKMR